MTDEKFAGLRHGERITPGQYVYTEVLCDGSTPCAANDAAMADHHHWRTGRGVLVADLLRELREKLEWQAACTKALMESQERQAGEIMRLREALEHAHGIIAANRLVLGEFEGPREVADVERRIRSALGRAQDDKP